MALYCSKAEIRVPVVVGGGALGCFRVGLLLIGLALGL